MYPQRCLALLHPILAKKLKCRHTKNNSNKNIDLQKEKRLTSSEEQHYLQTLKISHKVTTAFFIPFSYKSLQNDSYDNNLIIITVLIAPVPSLIFNAVFAPVFVIEGFQVRKQNIWSHTYCTTCTIYLLRVLVIKKKLKCGFNNLAWCACAKPSLQKQTGETLQRKAETNKTSKMKSGLVITYPVAMHQLPEPFCIILKVGKMKGGGWGNIGIKQNLIFKHKS